MQRKWFAEQQYCLDGELGSRLLQNALRDLKHHGITITLKASCYGGLDSPPAWTPYGLLALETSLLPPPQLDDFDDGFTDSAMHVLIAAIAHAEYPVRELDLFNDRGMLSPPDFPSTATDQFVGSKKYMLDQRLHSCFSALRSLSLSWSISTYDTSHLLTLLRAATGLESFSINLECFAEKYRVGSDFSELGAVFGDVINHLDRAPLTSLTLREVYGSYDQFRTLLLMHKHTLHTLDLVDVFLVGDHGWREVFSWMAKEMRLEKLFIESDDDELHESVVSLWNVTPESGLTLTTKGQVDEWLSSHGTE